VGVLLLGLFISSIEGKYLGIQQQTNGIWRVYNRKEFLDYFGELNLRDKEASSR